MKNLLALILIAGFVNLSAQAQRDTSAYVEYAAGDSIKIADIVRLQIEAARIRDSIKTAIPAEPSKAEILAVPAVKKAEKAETKVDYFAFLNGISIEIRILAVFSFIVFMWVFSRRALIYFKKRDKILLKKNIALLREEKVPQKMAKRSRKAKKDLSRNLSGMQLNEKLLARKARELNIAKGELLLASRLKNFELGKV